MDLADVAAGRRHPVGDARGRRDQAEVELPLQALLVFPGGFGTMDELFEILTLVQTRKAPPAPIVLFDERYWRRVLDFDALIEEDMIEPTDLALFDFADTAEAAWEVLIRRGLKAHSGDGH